MQQHASVNPHWLRYCHCCNSGILWYSFISTTLLEPKKGIVTRVAESKDNCSTPTPTLSVFKNPTPTPTPTPSSPKSPTPTPTPSNPRGSTPTPTPTPDSDSDSLGFLLFCQLWHHTRKSVAPKMTAVRRAVGYKEGSCQQ